MHENLKFNLIVKNEEWQPILASQVHGTFFGVFIKFHDFKINEKKHTCSLYLQNFRGSVSLGLQKPVDVDHKHDTTGKSVFIMNFTILPFSVSNKIDKIKIDFKNTFRKPSDMQNTDSLDVQFRLGSPPISLFDPENLGNSLYIDPYKFYRDGECFVPIEFKNDDTVCPNENIQVESEFVRPGGICDMTISNIIAE